MNDEELSQLFRSGTAPDRDAAFSEATNRRVRHHQQIATLLTIVKICSVTMLVVGLFVLTQMYQAMFGVPGSETSLSPTAIAMPLIVAATCSVVTFLRRHAH